LSLLQFDLAKVLQGVDRKVSKFYDCSLNGDLSNDFLYGFGKNESLFANNCKRLFRSYLCGITINGEIIWGQ